MRIRISKLRIGLIGAGAIGKVHLEGFKKLKNIELVAISSRTHEHASAFANKFNIPKIYVEDSWKDMLKDENLDIISICTPNYLHAPMLLESIKQNINILCEKPICITREELNSIESALNKKDLILFTAFHKRYIPIMPIVKDIVEHNILGKITLVRFMFAHLGPYISHQALSKEHWFFDSEKAGGGVLLDLGVHCIDLFRYLIDDYEKVEGITQNNSCINMKDEDNGNIMFRFKNDALGIINVSWCTPPIEFIEIFGTKGYIKLDLLAQQPFNCFPSELNENELIKKAYNCKIHNLIPHHLLIAHFIKCVLENKQDNPDFNDGKKAVEFILDAYSL